MKQEQNGQATKRETVVRDAALTLQMAMGMPSGIQPPDMAHYFETAIYDADIEHGKEALHLMEDIARQAKIALPASVAIDALNRTGFPAWLRGEDSPASFSSQRHSALLFDITGTPVFVAALRPIEADEEYTRCIHDMIRQRVSSELAASERDWPKETNAPPERQFARIDFLARDLRSRLMGAAMGVVEEALQEAWSPQAKYSTGAVRMRTQLEELAFLDVEDALQQRGYVIQGLSTDPVHVIDPHWNLKHQRFFDDHDSDE